MKTTYQDSIPHAVNYIREMFARTRNGVLQMEEEDEEVIYRLDWDQATAEKMTLQVEALLHALAGLGVTHSDWENCEENVPAELKAVWQTYIMPYPDHGMDRQTLFEISMKAECDEPLTEEEEEMLEQERQWMRAHALTRLPYNRTHPANLIQRARRYEKLVALNAPAVVINHEARCFAERYVLYCCEK